MFRVAQVLSLLCVAAAGLESWSPSATDLYVGFGAGLVELTLLSRHLDAEKTSFEYQGPLPFETELKVERIKLDFAKNLRKSFRERYPDRSSPPDQWDLEDQTIPYYVSDDVARVLIEEGYRLPLRSANRVISRETNNLIEAERQERRLKEQSGTEERDSRSRELFSFSVICDDECQTDLACWGASKALNGLTMEQTCNLLEKIQQIAKGSWEMNDWLRELPQMMNVLKDIKSIGGVVRLDNCGATATIFDEYGHFGKDAVLYYPKAMCDDVNVFRGCLMEMLKIMVIILGKPVGNYIPDDVKGVLLEINSLIRELYGLVAKICIYLNEIGLLQGSALEYFSNWQDLFQIVPSTHASLRGKTKLELLITVLEELTAMSVINEYLPAIPRGCAAPLSSAAHQIYTTVFAPNLGGDVDDVPKAICRALGPTAVNDCLVGLTNNLDQVSWIADSLGNGNLHRFAEEVIPSLCGAISDLDGISIDDIFKQLPLILRVYQSLDLDMLGSILPGVHPVLVKCGNNFADLVEKTDRAFDSNDPRKILKFLCGPDIIQSDCLIKLADGLDQLDFAREALGEGTLKTILRTSLPDACVLTRKVVNLDATSDQQLFNSISTSTLLPLLPDVITWYQTISNLKPVRGLLPQWPASHCPNSLVQSIAGDISYGIEHPDLLPAKVCTLTNSAQTNCLMAIAMSLEQSDLVRPLFQSSLASSGPKATMEVIIKDLLVQLCRAIDSTSIDPSDVIRTIPVLLDAYRKLDIIPLRNLMPSVHTFIMNRECSTSLNSAVTTIGDIMEGTDKDPVRTICTKFGHHQCLIQLSQAFDQVEFIRTQIGAGTLELVLDIILPQVCDAIVTATSSFDLERLIETLPDLLLLVNKLSTVESDPAAEKSSFPLQPYIPQIPSDLHCRKAFQAIAKEFFDFTYSADYKLSTLLDEICIGWPNKKYIPCLVRLGDSFDNVKMIRDYMGGEHFIQTVVTTLLPSACQVLSPESSLVSWNSSGIIESLPIIVDWYHQLADKAPGFLKGYLPAFPAEKCPAQVIKQFQDHALYATENQETIVQRTLQVFCVHLTKGEKDCLIGIGDSIDASPDLVQALGLPKGMIQKIIGEDLDRACSIIGDEFDNIHYGNIVAKIPEILRFITSLRETVPAFAQSYLPIIPHARCDTSYNSTTLKFSDGLQEDGVEKLPAIICSLEQEEVECISLLGDALDDVEFILGLIGDRGLVRYAMETIRGYACTLFDDISTMNLSNMAKTLPTAMGIIDTLYTKYPVLQSFIPAVPPTCKVEVPPLADQLAIAIEQANGDVETAVPKALCNSNQGARTCLAELGRNLEYVEWAASLVPRSGSVALDLLKLLPPVCALVFSVQTEASRNFGDPDTLLEYLPIVLSLLDNLRDAVFVQPYVPPISATCMSKFKALGNEMSSKGLKGVPKALCRMTEETKTCLVHTASEMEQMDVYKPFLPVGLVKDLMDTLPDACAVFESLGDMDYGSIVSTIPSFLDYVARLNNIQAIRAYVPDISPSCTQVYKTSLVPRYMREGSEGLPRAICGTTQAETRCIKQLVGNITSIPFVAELASSQLQVSSPQTPVLIESAVDALFEILPEACGLFSAISSNLNGLTIANNVFVLIPKVLDLLDALAKFPILSKYIPTIDAGCSQEYRALFAPGGELSTQNNLILFPRTLCSALLVTYPRVPSCLQALGKEINGLSMVTPDLNVENLVNALITVLPHACRVINEVITLPDGALNFTAVFEAIPTLAFIYAEIQSDLPTPLASYAPPFPSETCNSAVLTKLASNIQKAVLGEEALDVPTFLCTDISKEEKECIAALGDTLDQVAMVQDMLGRRGILRELVGEPIDAICSLLGQPPEGGSVHVSNLLSHLDTVFHVIDVAHNVAPDFVKDFLPKIPGGDCREIAYPRLGTVFSEFSVHRLCSIDALDAECLSKLGDSIEETPVFVNLLYGDEATAAVLKARQEHKSLLRLLVEAIHDPLCQVFDSLGEFSYANFLTELPYLLDIMRKLWEYPMLQDFVPKMPDSCLNGVGGLVEQLRDPDTAVEQALCNMRQGTKDCLVDFGHSIEMTQWTATRVPNATGIVSSLLEVVPVVCMILDGGFSESDVLKYLPVLLELFFKLDGVALANGLYDVDVGESCRVDLAELGTHISTLENVGLIPNELCIASVFQMDCLKKVGGNIEKLPVISGILPAGIFGNLVEVFRTGVCPILENSGEIDFAGVVKAIPDFMVLLADLEQVSFLRPFLPDISPQCKHLFATSIKDKVLSGMEFATENGLVSIGTSISFAGTSHLLCAYNETETQCFQDVSLSISKVDIFRDMIASQLPLQPSGEPYSLEGLVDSTFEVKDIACELLQTLGKADFRSVFYSIRDIIKIVDKLNDFPVLHEYVPNFDDSCVNVLEDFVGDVTGANPLVDTCAIKPIERQCLVHIGRKLDEVAEVRYIYGMMGGNSEGRYSSIEFTIHDFVYDVLDSTCALFLSIGLDLEGFNMAYIFSKVPGFLKNIQNMGAIAFFSDFAPKLSEKCFNALSSFFGSASEEDLRDFQGVKLICKEQPEEVLPCIVELDESFQRVSIIAEHLRAGLLPAFINSLDSGCAFFAPNPTREQKAHLMNVELPRLLASIGIIAGVSQQCSTKFADSNGSICSVGNSCLQEYLVSVMRLPLIGAFLPGWTLDFAVNLCAVQSGESSLTTFVEEHLPAVLKDVAALDGIANTCSESLSSIASGMEEKRVSPEMACTDLQKASPPEGSNCIKQVVDSINQVPLVQQFSIGGLDELLWQSCNYLTQPDRTVFAMLPHLPTLLHVLSFVLGQPSTTCGNQVADVAAPMQRSGVFSSREFCAGVSQECTTEVIFTLRKLPFVGDQLPVGIDQLIGASCAMVRDRSNYIALVEHIPALLDVMGKIVLGNHVDFDEDCQQEIRLFLSPSGRSRGPATSSASKNKLDASRFCKLSPRCVPLLIDGMQDLPLVGEHIPDSMVDLLKDICVYADHTQADGRIKLTDDAGDPQGLPTFLPGILLILARILGNSGTTRRALQYGAQENHRCADEITAYASGLETVQIKEMCSSISGFCMVLIEDMLLRVPFIRDFVPVRAGELLATACDAINLGEAGKRKFALERIPSLLSISASVLELDTACFTAIETAANEFKARGGELDGKRLCTGLSTLDDSNKQTCIDEVSQGLFNLPFVGAFVPSETDTLIEQTCNLLRESIPLSEYFANEGPFLLEIAGFAAGVNLTCSNGFRSVKDIFSLQELCSLAGAPCLSALATGLSTLPLVGKYIPPGLDLVFDDICGFASKRLSWSQFARSTLPKLLAIVGKSLTDSDVCAYQLESFGIHSMESGGVHVESMCRVQPSCFDKMVDGLSYIPLWGPLVPKETSGVIRAVCALHKQEEADARGHSEAHRITSLLASNFTVIVEFMSNLAQVNATCKQDLADSAAAMKSEWETVGSVNPVASICRKVRPSCISAYVEGYRSLPLFSQLVPPDVDILLNLVCPSFALASSEEVFKSVFVPGGLLDRLTPSLPLLKSFSVVSQECDEKIDKAAGLENAGQPGSWEEIFACHVGQACMGELVDGVLALPIVNAAVKLFVHSEPNLDQSHLLQNARSIIVDQPCLKGAGDIEGNPTIAPTGSSSSNVAAIAGGVLGGLVLLTAIALSIMYFRKKREFATSNKDGDAGQLTVTESQSIIPRGYDDDGFDNLFPLERESPRREADKVSRRSEKLSPKSVVPDSEGRGRSAAKSNKKNRSSRKRSESPDSPDNGRKVAIG